ncbi:hypothetical protein OG948_36260 (plasmid) [Embleya sp. NBC_00888]|uniref:hypothetical protein n=1 Tax=Embleya sp. NBC_00888 TaxID=2975960 RepID=UPI002F90716F|nr:hypothetical protein OG948_36260 [Embleya sp. NBC_00888]
MCLVLVPGHLDEDDAALALVAHLRENGPARVRHALACRRLVMTGDPSPLDAYFAAADIDPAGGFDREEVAVGRRTVEQERMPEWTATGVHAFDEE